MEQRITFMYGMCRTEFCGIPSSSICIIDAIREQRFLKFFILNQGGIIDLDNLDTWTYSPYLSW